MTSEVSELDYKCHKCISVKVCKYRAGFDLMIKGDGRTAPIDGDDLAKICKEYKENIVIQLPKTASQQPDDAEKGTIELPELM